MKKGILSIAFIMFLSFAITAQETYVANITNSKIEWKGFKPAGSHHGVINIENGTFKVNNGSIVGGEFKIDMNSIVNLDLKAESEYNAKLVNHLKSADFFDVEKFPTAKFTITETEKRGDKTLVKGNLSLKDKTNPVEFYAMVSINGDKLTFQSETFKIDRSKWNVQYKSKSFFDNLADKFIYDEMEITVSVNAKK